MKIGLVCPYNITVGGGVQECVFAQQRELTARGHQAVILSPRPRSYHGDAPSGVRFIGRAARVKSFHTTSQVSATAETDAIDTLLAEYNFDILHFHEPWVPLISQQILKRSQACNIATFHAKLPENFMNRTIERAITPYTSSVIKYLTSLTAVSDAAADYVSSLTDQRITIIPNGIDLQTYKKAMQHKPKTKPSHPRIVFVGRLERRKGLMYLLKAFRILKERCPDAMLDIVGSGPDEKRLRQFIDDYDVSDVHFYGYVTESEKIRIMQDGQVFCSPAPYGESFGIVLLEAMALSMPVVAGDNPGYRAVMQDRGRLSIVNPKDSVALADKLQLFIEDEALVALWRSWADAYVAEFSYQRIVDAYEKLYKDSC